MTADSILGLLGVGIVLGLAAKLAKLIEDKKKKVPVKIKKKRNH